MYVLSSVHKPPTVNTFYINTKELEHPTLFDPCPNVFHIKEKYSYIQVINSSPTYSEEESTCDANHLGCTVFKQTKDDNQVTPSIQDASFMNIIDEGLQERFKQQFASAITL